MVSDAINCPAGAPASPKRPALLLRPCKLFKALSAFLHLCKLYYAGTTHTFKSWRLLADCELLPFMPYLYRNPFANAPLLSEISMAVDQQYSLGLVLRLGTT